MAIWTPCENWGWRRIYSRMRRSSPPCSPFPTSPTSLPHLSPLCRCSRSLCRFHSLSRTRPQYCQGEAL
ncbi:hypothetical protein FA95DRAFT_1557809, partial [Auriscalpium vulgare]